jgi:hypothetical protein
VNGYFISSSNVQIEASPSPSSISDIMTDQYGNQYKQLTWELDENTSASFSKLKAFIFFLHSYHSLTFIINLIVVIVCRNLFLRQGYLAYLTKISKFNSK